jgi:hypothetical protein
VALGRLGHLPALRSLHLNLVSNDIGAAGCKALLALAGAPLLDTLHLNLQSNDVGDEGAECVGAFAGAPRLSTVHLDLRNNAVGDRGVCALSRLASLPRLRRCTLILDANVITAAAFPHIAAFRLSPSLQSLCVSLHCNPVLGDGPSCLESTLRETIPDARVLC